MNRTSISGCLMVVLTLTILGCNAVESTDATEFPEEGTVRIIRDTWGVPHIYASTLPDAAYGLGLAMAEDRIQQIFTSKLTAMGRLAEIAGERSLNSDIAMRSFQIYEKAAALEAKLSTTDRDYIESFCRAINEFIELNRDSLPEWIDGYAAIDVVAQGVMINLYFPLNGLQNELHDVSRQQNSNDQRGSNQFAVAASRSASGNAMLVMDPHLPFSGPLVWAEAHIITPELNIVGNIVPSAPVINMGHNGHIAWANTNNFPDTFDLIAFPLADEQATTYKSHDGIKKFETINAVFTVKTEDGSKEVEQTLLISHAGPVLKVINGTAYVGRVDGYYAGDFVGQTLAKTRAKTIEEYFTAMEEPGMIMWNQMVIEKSGRIGYFWNGLVPERNPELSWRGAIPGDDPRSDYSSFVSPERLPKVIDPAAGWLQNCNDSPWHINSAGTISEEVLEDWMIYTTRYGYRGKRITELLANDDSVTFEEMMAYATDTKVLEATIWVPRLIAAYEQFEAEMDLAGSTTEEAINVLKEWDMSSEANATGMALFHNWMVSSNMRQFKDNLEAVTDDMMRKQMLEIASVAEELRTNFGAIDVPWGSVLYYTYGDRSYAMGGGGYIESMKTNWGSFGRNDNGRMSINAGSSYRMIVELGERPRAVSVFPTSMSRDPESPHFYDITELYAKGEYKPVLFSWSEVMENARYDTLISIGTAAATYVEIPRESDAKPE